jgi:hypothetical protein
MWPAWSAATVGSPVVPRSTQARPGRPGTAPRWRGDRGSTVTREQPRGGQPPPAPSDRVPATATTHRAQWRPSGEPPAYPQASQTSVAFVVLPGSPLSGAGRAASGGLAVIGLQRRGLTVWRVTLPVSCPGATAAPGQDKHTSLRRRNKPHQIKAPLRGAAGQHQRRLWPLGAPAGARSALPP